jgi:short-subunit dehydrogenase
MPVRTPPGQAAYCASKFAVRGFAEALRHELEGTNVRVSTVHPGGVRTGIARSARIGAGADPSKGERERRRFERLAITSPEQAAERIMRGMLRGEPRILVGRDASQIDRIQRLLPKRYWRLLRALVERRGGRAE